MPDTPPDPDLPQGAATPPLAWPAGAVSDDDVEPAEFGNWVAGAASFPPRAPRPFRLLVVLALVLLVSTVGLAALGSPLRHAATIGELPESMTTGTLPGLALPATASPGACKPGAFSGPVPVGWYTDDLGHLAPVVSGDATGISPPSGPRPRPLSDPRLWHLGPGASFVRDATVAGVPYPDAIALRFSAASGSASTVSLDTAALPGYGAIHLWLGTASGGAPDSAADVRLIADGVADESAAVASASASAAPWVISLAGRRHLTFVARMGSGPLAGMVVLLADPVAVAPSPLSVDTFHPLIGAGQEQMVEVRVPMVHGQLDPSALVTLVVAYPDGVQALLRPLCEVAYDDLPVFRWRIPEAVHGRVLITASTGAWVAQDTFLVEG